MDKRERFFRTLSYQCVDRPAWWLGLPTAEAEKILFRYFKARNFYELKKAVDDDVWTVEMPYCNGTSNAVYAAFDFAKKGSAVTNEERTLTSPGFFEDYEDESAVDLFDWPDPKKHIAREACDKMLERIPQGYPVLALIWSAHFQDACAAFGMEDALVKMKTAPGLFRRVIDRITEFYLEANGLFYEYTEGKIDAVLIGNDFGTQSGLIISPWDLEEFVFKGTAKLIAQAHSYGLKVIHHSCGAIEPVIPAIVAAGADCIHPIQALAEGMEPKNLAGKYGGKVAFCGGVDVQNLLVHGTPRQIADKAAELKEIFNTGLIISPSHEAILPDVPPENIEALSIAVKGE